MTSPGWYSEPGNPTVERYWDGKQWTPQMRATASSETRPPEPPHEPRGSAWSTTKSIGLVVTLVGVVLVLIAYLTGTWLSDPSGELGSFDFGAVRHAITTDTSGDVPGLVNAYFSWLAWLLLAAMVVLFGIAYVPSSQDTAFRVAGLLVVGAAVALTFASVAQFGGLSNYLHYEDGAGFWLAVSGYVGVAIGGVFSAF